MDVVRDLWMQLEICSWKPKRRVVSLTSERTMPFLLIQLSGLLSTPVGTWRVLVIGKVSTKC